LHTVCTGRNLCKPSETYVDVGFGQRVTRQGLLTVAIGSAFGDGRELRNHLGQNAAKFDEHRPGLRAEAYGCVDIAVGVGRKRHGPAERVARSPHEVGYQGSGMSGLDELRMDEKIGRLEPNTWLEPGGPTDGLRPRAGRFAPWVRRPSRPRRSPIVGGRPNLAPRRSPTAAAGRRRATSARSPGMSGAPVRGTARRAPDRTLGQAVRPFRHPAGSRPGTPSARGGVRS
jgi:hypothetical protein